MRKPVQAGKSKAAATRGRTWRFTHAGSLISPNLRKAAEKQGFVQTRLLTEWDAIVGADLADLARPIKVSYARKGFGATLTLLVEGANAPQVQMMVPHIRERVNACYGYSAISQVRLTQTSPTGFREPKTPYRPAPPRELPVEAVETLRSELSEVGDQGLRDALLALGKNIRAKSLN